MNARQWINEIAAAKKREKDWRELGKKVLDIYAGEKSQRVAFNIVYSNTETLMPSLYSAIPRPVVDRRFKDDDPIGKAAAVAGRRGLEFLLDTNVEGYETYDEGVRAAVLDALLPGRGVTQVKYDAEIVEEPKEKDSATKTEADTEGGDDVEEGEPEEPLAYKKGELVCLDACKWDDFLHGYAKKWSKVPWVAFAKDIDKGEAKELFGKRIAGELVYADERDNDEGKKSEAEDRGSRLTTRIWLVWVKESRKVLFVSESYADGFLKKPVDDPLGLSGFYPIPKPIMFVEKANDLSPSALYSLYEKQAEELNRLSERIIKLVQAIRARGIYDGELGDDLANLMEAADNELIPADKTSSLAAEKGLQNAIWWMPVEQLVGTLQQLYQAREACKAVIWEIMGIADIMRGSSAASETLGAQQIKQAWGSLRLKRMQKEVARYCRDLLRLMLEVAANKFSEDTWAKMTGLPYLTESQFAQAQAQFAALQQMAASMPPPMPPMPGQPPSPPDPRQQQLQQQLAAAQAELQKPKWADVLALLKDDLQRAYRIDVETNSTIEPEAAEDQKSIAELLNAIAQFVNGVGPMVEQGIMPFDAVKAMLLTVTKRFRFGIEIEDQIKAMKAPEPKDDGTQQKMAMEKQKHDAEMQQKQIDGQAKQSEMALKAQADERKHALEMEKMDRQAEFDRQEHMFKMAELSAKTQMSEVVNASKIKVAMTTAAMKEKAASQPPKQGAAQ